MLLANETGPVASPVAARPTSALIKELGAIFESCLNLALAVVLDPCLPLMAYKPACDKVVVVGVENPFSPFLILEAVKEVVALQNFRSVSACATRHARCTAVHVVRSRDLKVAAFNVCGAEPVPQAVGKRSIPFSTDSLVCPNTAHLWVLERSENPGHESRGPGDIVISHDGNGRLDMRQSLANLKTLVGNWSVENANVRVPEGSSELIQIFPLVVRCHQDELRRVGSKNALQRVSKLLKHVMNGWNNNSNILVCESWLGRDRLGLVHPMADTMNEKAEIAMDPVVSCKPNFTWKEGTSTDLPQEPEEKRPEKCRLQKVSRIPGPCWKSKQWRD